MLKKSVDVMNDQSNTPDRPARRRLLMLAGLSAVSLLMAGCASAEPEDTDAWKNRQSKVLAERAEARWKAVMAADYEKAYQYLSPARRAVVSLQQFKAGFGSVLDWRVARAVDIQYDGPTVASISMEVTYRFVMPRSGGKEIESIRVLIEKWLYSDGEWWYTSN